MGRKRFSVVDVFIRHGVPFTEILYDARLKLHASKENRVKKYWAVPLEKSPSVKKIRMNVMLGEKNICESEDKHKKVFVRD